MFKSTLNLKKLNVLFIVRKYYSIFVNTIEREDELQFYLCKKFSSYEIKRIGCQWDNLLKTW